MFFGEQLLRKAWQDNGEHWEIFMKKLCWIVGAIFLIVVITLGAILLRLNRVDMEFVKTADVCFLYGDTDTLYRLENKELESIKAIFNGKKMYKDNLSCGFSEAVSIIFNNEHTFCIAQDTCPIVYWREEDRYIILSEDEKIQLYNLLEQYGFYFPCI